MPTVERTLQEIEREYGSKVARAFTDAVPDLRDSVTLRRVVN